MRQMITWWVNTSINIRMSIRLSRLFCCLFSKPLRPNVLSQRVFSLYLLSSSRYFFVFKVYIFPQVLQMLLYQLCVTVLQLCLGCKKKLVVFRWTNSNLDGAVLKNVSCQIYAIMYMAATTASVPDKTANSNCFSNCFSYCFAWERIIPHLYSLIFSVYYFNYVDWYQGLIIFAFYAYDSTERLHVK